MIEVLTDNKNRTSAEIRNFLEKKGGNMSGTGSVAWQFHKKGFIVVKKTLPAARPPDGQGQAGAGDEDRLMTIALDAGASDFAAEKDYYAITTEPQDFEKVKKAVMDAGIATESAEITMIPQATVNVSGDSVAKQVLDLVESLEEHEDVQHVYANFDISDELLQKLA